MSAYVNVSLFSAAAIARGFVRQKPHSKKLLVKYSTKRGHQFKI